MLIAGGEEIDLLEDELRQQTRSHGAEGGLVSLVVRNKKERCVRACEGQDGHAGWGLGGVCKGRGVLRECWGWREAKWGIGKCTRAGKREMDAGCLQHVALCCQVVS